MKEKQKQTKLFDQPDLHAKRSTFDLSYPNKMTLNFNKIVPTCCKKTMPGDSWHVKTSVFSRWLAMQAPTFSEYDIKFLNAYVPNNIIWGGWQQFAGQGDAQASQYLLPGTITNLANNQVPNFTTRDLSIWFARKLFGFNFQWKDSNGNLHPMTFPCLTPFGAQFFRAFVCPVVCRKFDDAKQLWALTNTVTLSDFLCANDKFYVKLVMVVGSVLDSDFWDEIVNRGWCLEIPQYDANDTDVNTIFEESLNYFTATQRAWDFAFLCNSANQEAMDSNWASGQSVTTIIELPKNTFFPSTLQDFEVHSSSDYLESENMTKTQWEQYYITRMIPRMPAVTSGDGLMNQHFESDNYFPFGYIYTATPEDLGLTKLNHQEIFDRTFGQHIIYQLLGAGSLTDYLGKCYSQSLVRQPFEVANAILGYYQNGMIKGSWNKPNTTVATAVKGTYNENSMKFEIGVINDVRISVLPYLAYHKIWNDYIRDPRYEMRFLYSDPYRSPFMQPLFGQGNNLRNGTFIQGSFLSNTASDTYDPYQGVVKWAVSELSNPYYDNRTTIQTKITPSAPFGLFYICDLLRMRERRVVHDFFTMLTPTAQYSNEAVMDVQTGMGGQYIGTLAVRMASRLQKFLERSNFAGSDFIKQTLAHFGVKPDHCQHCSVKYLGGKVMTPTISPVTMSSQDSSETNQVTGQQSAQMYCSGNLEKVSFSTNEHGYYFQLVTIQNDFFTTDGQEVDPIVYMDYPSPVFADLGPEPLPLARVVNTDGTSVREGNNTHPLSVFGYIPRYAQWKCSLAEIHGDFRKTLSYWVSKRQLDPDLLNGSFGYGKRGNTPQIGSRFLYENPDYQAFAYSGDEFDHALLDIDHQITVSRELPMLPSPNVL